MRMGHIAGRFLCLATLVFIGWGSSQAATSRWGANYFPNVPLTTHEGKTVHFFEDLIKDKIVVINFIYTRCPDTCPLETAQLTRVQGILGDRLGDDIFFYSITIDPDNDTVEALRSYREKFGAKWTFLTGNKQDIVSLRRKLGLYIEDIQGGENNHNVNMIIGNQTTGRWMKRSPFENPYVLADQLGNWLTGWKAPQHVKDFANAPALREISNGEQLYRTRCVTCHTMDGSADAAIGPDLLNVQEHRERDWLISWLRAPDKMLAERDPIALELYRQFNQVAMPNLRLSPVDIQDLLSYMEEESRLQSVVKDVKEVKDVDEESDVVAVMNAWVRQTLPALDINAGYMTLLNVGADDVTLVGVSSNEFTSIGMHEMKVADGMMEMHEMQNITIPAGGQIQFKPGGKHLMLEEPQTSFVKGQTIGLNLIFDSGRKQSIEVKVIDK